MLIEPLNVSVCLGEFKELPVLFSKTFVYSKLPSLSAWKDIPLTVDVAVAGKPGEFMSILPAVSL